MILLGAAQPPVLRADETAAGIEFFETKIRPVLVRHCYECHAAGSEDPKGGLRLDWCEAMREGGESGPAVVPGKVDESLLVDALRHESWEMPPEGKLSDAVVADFIQWIEMGAPDPRDTPPDPELAARESWQAQVEERRDWWSLQPVVEPAVPTVRDASWSAKPVDRFVLAKLEKAGLHPAPRADRTTLIRRLSFALTGLPPTPDDVRAWLEDDSPNAWERLVDRLLDSPHFGPRWARHWMDVVRYTDTYGYEWDIPAKGAWRYRDYLIRAFNNDVPFEQLIREQIAGDLLARPRIDRRENINESLIGLMFFQMGEKRHGDSAQFNGIHQEMLDNKIDAFSKAFQATTVSCARCHDHKLDPIAQQDYYALAGVFMSSRWVTNTLDTPQRNAARIRKLKELKLQLRGELAALWQKEAEALANQLVAAETALADEHPPEGKSTAPKHTWHRLLDKRREAEPPREDLLFPWLELAKANREGESVAARWQELAEDYAHERKERIEQNQQDFVVAADFREEVPDGWSVDGVGLREVTPCGDFTLALDGEQAVGRLLHGGFYTHAISPRFNGALRTPYLNEFEQEHISFEHVGGDFSTHRTVVDNAFLTERQVYLNQNKLGWLRLSTFPSMRDRRIYIELATKTSNPNFPPRVGLGGKCTEEQAADPRSWFGVSRVLLHDKPAAPADELPHFAALLQEDPPKDLPAAARRYADWFGAALEVWQAGRASPSDVLLINWLLENQLLTNRHELVDQPQITGLVNRYRRLEAQLKTPKTVNGMADLDPGYDYRLNIRGDYDQLGDPVRRGYLPVLAGPEAKFESSGSGRRKLAELIASPDNPLTARVLVNRVWHWLFGTGIVATPNDFGHLGDMPSHPELLDYLASRFMKEGWSLKKLIRELVLSETWRQSTRTTTAARTADPDNRLWHHYPLRRLQAECIRDAMLAVSGRLDDRLYGRPIDPPRASEDPKKRLFSGPLDGNGRRSIYTKITIMEPPRLLATFNQPKPKLPTGKRDVTNTPAQSLALMNNPFVLEQAEQWARQLVSAGHTSTDQRLRHMFETAYGRPPTPKEIQRWSAALLDLAALHEVDQDQCLENVPLWTEVAHAVFNTKEFIYLK